MSRPAGGHPIASRYVASRYIAVAALVLSALPATAQVAPPPSTRGAAPPPLSVGARVRTWAPAPGRPGGWLVGTAVAVDQHGVEIRETRTGEVWNVLFTGARLEVSRGLETPRYGAAAGAVGGFLIGEVVGFLLVRPTGGRSANFGTRFVERLRSPAVLLIGAGGAVAGFVVGRRLRTERWEPVTSPTTGGPSDRS